MTRCKSIITVGNNNKDDSAHTRTTVVNDHLHSQERQWLTNQSTGELDDTKLVDGFTGERMMCVKIIPKHPLMR